MKKSKTSVRTQKARARHAVVIPVGGFPWGTRIKIRGKAAWLNQCIKCNTSGECTYHIIPGNPPRKQDDERDNASHE